MAYHDAVRYIEKMNPGYVAVAGEECTRTQNIIRTASGTLSAMPGTVEWRSDAADLYERRLKETNDLADGLFDGFRRAGAALTDYAGAQARAKSLVADGAASEKQLGSLIAELAGSQSWRVRGADPLSQWNDLRSVTGVMDWLAETGKQDEIDKVRPEADALWSRATTAFEDALRVEREARATAVAELQAAYKLLPDFLANSALSANIVAKTPGLDDGGDSKYKLGPPTVPPFEFDEDFPYDPDASATAGDYVSWNEWMAKLRAGRALRPDLDDATALYGHYMDGTGTDMRVDYEEAYAEDPAIRKAVDAEILRAQQEAERIARESGQGAFQMTGQPSSVRSLGGYPETENWQKALGDHQLYGTSEVVVNGNQVTMKIKVHAEDMYNFNKGAADIETGAPDNENGRFSTLGWAKGFATHGELERTVTWTIGDPGSVVTGGDGPSRDVTSNEDRADGRGDG